MNKSPNKRQATFNEVERFLSNLFGKMKISEIIFLDDRKKNRDALLELDIVPADRISAIKSLTVEDYSEGPILDVLNLLGEMWVFGKDVNEKEVYIKISLGLPNRNSICVSFHPSEHPMKYPYKNQ